MSKSSDITKDLKVLGHKSIINTQDPSADILESFPNRFPNRNYLIRIDFPEFTSLCPVTGQPDFANIRLEYIADKLCVESKSYKLYMFAYRNHQSFMETITNTILEDIDSCLKPRWVRVTADFAPRGATKLQVIAEQYNDKNKELKEQVEAYK